MARPFLAINNDKITTSSDDPSTAYAALTISQEAYPGLRFHMRHSVLDIIHKEVVDWRDSSWTSTNLPGNKTCEDTVQPCTVAAPNVMLILVGSLCSVSLFLGRTTSNRTGER